VEDFREHARHVVDFREHAGIKKEAGNMSDEDRKKLPSETEDIEETGEDVEAHVKSRDANDEGDGDDVEAHVKSRD
jgi:hypothetical protein